MISRPPVKPQSAHQAKMIVWGLLQMISRGFTIIELLVVIAIITLVSSFMVPKFLQFKDSEDLADNAAKMQSSIKLTQANALSSYNCGDQFNPTQKTIDWRMNINAGSYTIIPNCPNGNNTPTSTTSFPSDIYTCNIIFDDGGNVTLPASCDSSINSTVTFDALTGKVNFLGVVNHNRMVVVLTSKITNTKFGIFVEKGGLIYSGAF